MKTNAPPFQLFFHGGLTPNRGLTEMIYATALLIQQGFNVQFTIVGEGSYRGTLQQTARQLNIEGQIIFKGLQPYEMMPNLISQADLCTLPYPLSDYWEGNVPIKLLEYMAMEKVVLCSNLRIFREITESKTCAIFIEDNEPKKIADAVQIAITHKEKLAAWGKVGRNIVNKQYTWETVSLGLQNYFTELAQNEKIFTLPQKTRSAENLFGSVLHIAPNVKYWHCGIMSVVTTYRNNISNFEYHPSTGHKNKLLNALTFPFVFISFMITLVRKKHIRIVHLHGSARGSFVRKYLMFMMAKYLFRKKVVLHMHAADFHEFYEKAFSMLKQRIRHFITQVDCVLVLSSSWKQYFSETFQEGNFTILPNIVENVSVPKIYREIKSNSPLTFLFLGEIGDRKGLFDLIQVIAKHQDTFRFQCHFKIGGSGEIERLQSAIQAHHIDDLVEFMGFVSGEEKISLLKSSDVYILPSYNEGVPISILEAMSYGMPVIATTVGGIPEIVKDQENGITMPPGDQEALAKALLFFINHPSVIPCYGKKSYGITAKKHFPTQVLQLLEQVYQKVLTEE